MQNKALKIKVHSEKSSCSICLQMSFGLGLLSSAMTFRHVAFQASWRWCTCCVINLSLAVLAMLYVTNFPTCPKNTLSDAPQIRGDLLYDSRRVCPEDQPLFQPDGQGLSFNPEHERPSHWSLCTSVCSSTPPSNSTQAVLINQFGLGESMERVRSVEGNYNDPI